ncbi:hypothetical protein B0H17DRAFT_1271033 [Mycena rosella]|uniref:Uncharacterized protein n=1 Tax=Mycena rosella TaxID=1033263 RepID=A0AAD7GN51_MYCRO|nr:hypothetical protein B0H17DRAFT_1271033 [Mycena rosella]
MNLQSDTEIFVPPPPPAQDGLYIYGYKIFDDFDAKNNLQVRRMGEIMCAETICELGLYTSLSTSYPTVILYLAIYSPDVGIITRRLGTRVPGPVLLQKLQQEIGLECGPTWLPDNDTFFPSGYTAKNSSGTATKRRFSQFVFMTCFLLCAAIGLESIFERKGVEARERVFPISASDGSGPPQKLANGPLSRVPLPRTACRARAGFVSLGRFAKLYALPPRCSMLKKPRPLIVRQQLSALDGRATADIEKLLLRDDFNTDAVSRCHEVVRALEVQIFQSFSAQLRLYGRTA